MGFGRPLGTRALKLEDQRRVSSAHKGSLLSEL